MALVIQKYGGTSVANAERVKAVAKRVVERKRNGDNVVVVVSAQAGLTDELINKAKAISSKPDKRELDMLLCTGEQVSVALLAMAIKELGEKAISYNAHQIKIRTTNSHTNAQITEIDTKKIESKLKNNHIVIVCGFQGINDIDDLTTLGRGGSDTTGVALGVALKADTVEIYTDVDGVYTADPRIVANPKKLEKISFDEMLELAGTGAKVLHSRSVELGYKYNVPIHLRSSFDESEGTIVCNKELIEEEKVVTGISHKLGESLIIFEGILNTPKITSTVFNKISENGIFVEIITQGAGKGVNTDLSFVTKNECFDEAILLAKELALDIGVSNVKGIKNLSMISLVGNIEKDKLGVLNKVLLILEEENVKPLILTATDLKISIVIEEIFLKKIINLLHKNLI